MRRKANRTNSPIAVAIGLHSLNGVISANIFIYTTALFLSSYPIAWIPYFFMGRTIIEVLTSFLIARYFSKNIKRSALILEITSIFAIAIMVVLPSMHWYLLPLIFSFVLTMAGLISNFVSWNNARNAFDIVEFKNISPLLSLASVIGKIVFSLGNVWLIKQFGIDYLPYCVAFAIFISCFCINALTLLPSIISTRNPVRNPIRYTVFRNLFIFSFILAFCYTLVDYTLRMKLASSYNSQEIGQFISIFTAITYSLSIVVTYLFSKQIIKLGITNLLEVLPIYWIIIPIGVMFYPNIAMIALMGAGDYVFFNFIKIGRSILLNVLPNEIRTFSELSIQTAAESIGIGVSSLFLIIITNYITIPKIAFSIILCSILLILIARKLQTNYISTLKSELLLKQFNVDPNHISAYQEIIKEKVDHFLRSADPNAIMFGYTLLSSIKLSKLPTQTLQHLYSSLPDIRIEAIKSIINHKEKSAINNLLQLLDKESDAEVKWWIISALSKLKPKQFINKAKEWVLDQSPEVKAASIPILFSSKEETDHDLAVTVLTNFLSDKDPVIRRIASRVLVQAPLNKIQKYLPIILNDPDYIVSSYDIYAIFNNNLEELAPFVVSRISKGGVFYSARKYINKLGKKAIPLLMQSIIENQNNIRIRNDILIGMLAQMRISQIDDALIELQQLPGIIIKQAVASETFFRAKHFQISIKLIKKAYQFAMEEAELIHVLRITLKSYTAEKNIFNELNSRIDLAIERYFNWIGVFSSSPEIHGVISTILRGNTLDQARAIELLSTLISNREIAQITLDIYSNNYINQFKHLSKPINQFYDDWISKVIKSSISYQHGKSMDTIQKIYTLRQVGLFKNLAAEELMVIAEETEVLSMSSNQTIFLENDPPTNLYIIVSGAVDIIRQKHLLASLKENDFFGELALIDNAPRAASAIAKSEGILLVLNKEIFDHVTNDLPQILRSVTQTVLSYLRKNLITLK